MMFNKKKSVSPPSHAAKDFFVISKDDANLHLRSLISILMCDVSIIM